VIVIGGGRKQVHVRAVPERMAAYGVTFDEINTATERAQGSRN
jgi:Cu/Ag efflux pump CusA